MMAQAPLLGAISIHAPVKGATTISFVVGNAVPEFQSTHP